MGSLFPLPHWGFITFSAIHKTKSFVTTILNSASNIRETNFDRKFHLSFITSEETAREIFKTSNHAQLNLIQGYLIFNHSQKESF